MYNHIVRSLTVLLLLLPLLVHTLPVDASQFNQTYTITYSFDERGNATVTKQIALTNLDQDVYPSQYYLDIPEDASNISAFDDIGKIELEIAYLGDKKQALLHLNSQNIGISNTTNIALVYETRQLVHKNSDWVISIPPTSDNESVSNAITRVNLPSAWGTPTEISPQPGEPFTWKEYEAVQGISIVYGELTPTPAPTESVLADTDTSSSYYGFFGLAAGVFIVLVSLGIAKAINRS